jgi:anti-sigma-K factor RskA
MEAARKQRLWRGRTLLRVLLAATFLAATPSLALADGVPVRVRIIKGSRQGPPSVDPKLADLQAQLSPLAYQRWEQVGERRAEMDFNKPLSIALPDGSTLELVLIDARKDTVTFEVRLPARKSRLTIAKDQRIVQQVASETNGAAFFATVRPWP